jgi:hypothetical protein
VSIYLGFYWYSYYCFCLLQEAKLLFHHTKSATDIHRFELVCHGRSLFRSLFGSFYLHNCHGACFPWNRSGVAHNLPQATRHTTEHRGQSHGLLC